MKNKTLINGIIVTTLINLLFLVSLFLCIQYGFSGWRISVFITLLMFVYHTDVRIIIGTLFTFLFKQKININNKIYYVKESEYKFLSKLGVKKWKDKTITIFKNFFVVKDIHNEDTISYVLKNNICAEVIHWVCFFVGFISILIGCMLSADEWYIYVITAILASFLVDMPSILVQRYNRYRLQKIRR